MLSKKKPRAGVAIRPVNIGGGEALEVGEYYEGPDLQFLIAIGKVRPFDPAAECVSVKDGRRCVERRAPVAGSAAEPADADVPDETWKNDAIREWLQNEDPGLDKIPANVSKAQLLEAVRDLLTAREA
jgi:hypothetical protein